jgi:hypothetical protein
VQTLGGTGNVELFGDGEERVQVPKVHGRRLINRSVAPESIMPEAE